MTPILIEGVLFVALVATVGALVYILIMWLTPAGVRHRQIQNRKRLDSAAALVCPIHGSHTSADLVRLTNGELMCPACYKEILNG